MRGHIGNGEEQRKESHGIVVEKTPAGGKRFSASQKNLAGDDFAQKSPGTIFLLDHFLCNFFDVGSIQRLHSPARSVSQKPFCEVVRKMISPLEKELFQIHNMTKLFSIRQLAGGIDLRSRRTALGIRIFFAPATNRSIMLQGKPRRVDLAMALSTGVLLAMLDELIPD